MGQEGSALCRSRRDGLPSSKRTLCARCRQFCLTEIDGHSFAASSIDQSTLGTECWMQDQMVQLKARVERLLQDNRRLEAERSRMLAVFQNLHKELNEAREEGRMSAESLSATKLEKERISRTFQQYRDTKETQLASLEKTKQRLEERLTSVGLPLPSDEMLNRALKQALPPPPQSPSVISSKSDVFGSCVSLNPFGSIATFASADYDRASEQELTAAAGPGSAAYFSTCADQESAMRSAAVIHLQYCTAGFIGQERINFAFQRDHLPSIRSILHERNRLCEYSRLTPKQSSLNDLTILVVFSAQADSDLSEEFQHYIKTLLFQEQNCVLAVFCAPDESSHVDFWQKILSSPKTRLCRHINEQAVLENVTNEIIQFLIAELDEVNDDSGYLGYHSCVQVCRRALSGSAFCSFGCGTVSTALLKQTILRSENCWLPREQLDEVLYSHLHSLGSAAPLLLRGAVGAGLSTALAKWIHRTVEALAPNVLLLYHQVLDHRSTTSDAYLMMRHFCKKLAGYRKPVPVSSQAEKNQAEIKRLFSDLIEHVGPQFAHGIVIVIDGLDRMDDFCNDRLHVLSWLFDPQPIDIRVIVTTGEKIIDRCINWPSFLISALNVRESLQLLRKLLPKESDADFVDLIASQLSTEPLRMPAVIHTIGSCLANHDSSVDRVALLHELLSAGPGNIFSAVLVRLDACCENNWNRREINVLWQVLKYLSCVRNGLSQHELLLLMPVLAENDLFHRVIYFLSMFCGGIIRNICGHYQLAHGHWRRAVADLFDLDVIYQELRSFWKSKSSATFRACEEALEEAEVIGRADVVLNAMERGMWSPLLAVWQHRGLSPWEACSNSVNGVGVQTGVCSLAIAIYCRVNQLNLEPAARLLQRSAEIFQCSLGADDPALAIVYAEMGRSYALHGKAALAERMLRRALSITENALTDDSNVLAEDIIRLLIDVSKSQNRFKAADLLEGRLKEMSAKRERSEKFQKRLEVLEKRRLCLSEAPETVRVLTQLGMMRFYYGELDAAGQLFQQALDMKIKLTGGRADPIELCREWQNIAAVGARRRDWRLAVECFRKVVDARDRKLGKTHPLSIASLRSLTECLMRVERPSAELEPLLRRLLDHYQAIGDVAQVVHTLSQLAAIFCRKGQHDCAEPLLDRALTIARDRLPDDHPAAKVAARVHAKLHLDVGDVEKAVQLCTRHGSHRPSTTSNVVKCTRFVLQSPPPGRSLSRRSSSAS